MKKCSEMIRDFRMGTILHERKTKQDIEVFDMKFIINISFNERRFRKNDKRQENVKIKFEERLKLNEFFFLLF